MVEKNPTFREERFPAEIYERMATLGLFGITVPALSIQGEIGQQLGYIAAAGVGLTSQYLEQFGRKLLGGLLGSVAGGLGRGRGRAGRLWI